MRSNLLSNTCEYSSLVSQYRSLDERFVDALVHSVHACVPSRRVDHLPDVVCRLQHRRFVSLQYVRIVPLQFVRIVSLQSVRIVDAGRGTVRERKAALTELTYGIVPRIKKAYGM